MAACYTSKDVSAVIPTTVNDLPKIDSDDPGPPTDIDVPNQEIPLDIHSSFAVVSNPHFDNKLDHNANLHKVHLQTGESLWERVQQVQNVGGIAHLCEYSICLISTVYSHSLI